MDVSDEVRAAAKRIARWEACCKTGDYDRSFWMKAIKRIPTRVACVFCQQRVVLDDDVCDDCKLVIQQRISNLRSDPNKTRLPESPKQAREPRVINFFLSNGKWVD